MATGIHPRYIGHLPDHLLRDSFASRLVEEKVQFFWDLRVTIRSSKKVVFHRSPSHSLRVLSQNDAQTELGLTLEEGTFLHKDFVLDYTTDNHHLPSSTFGRTDASCTAMLSFIPKFSDLKLSAAYV